MAIGEAGSLDTAQDAIPGTPPLVPVPIRVDFTENITDPVIVISGTQNGGDPYTIRITDSDETGFSFIIEEWEYLDGAHPAVETINRVAIAEGTHTLPGGRTVTAGSTTADGSGNTPVSFGSSFSSAPAVLTSVMSNNDITAVDSDPSGITTTGFNLSLQEEEAETGSHGSETIGWIAIETGGNNTGNSGVSLTQGGVNHNADTVNMGTTFTNGVYIADTQTINGGDTARVALSNLTSSSTGVHIQEEQSDDTETGHIDEVVGVIGFEEGLIPCFTPGCLIATPYGDRAVEALVAGDLVLTQDRGPQPLRWVCKRTLGTSFLAASPQHSPIYIQKDSIAPGTPNRDMRVSPQHRMLITSWKAQLLFGEVEILVPAKALINHDTIYVDQDADQVTYIHLLFDQHEIVTAENAPTESLHAGQLAKGLLPGAQRDELLGIFPELRSHNGSYGPTARLTPTVNTSRLLV